MITIRTSQKIALARVVSSVTLMARRLRGLPAHGVFRRGGLLWNLDLTEGIDFSIYLLGGFEPRTIRLYSRLIKSGATVLDIGANVGAHTLPLAQLVGPSGRVIAFEPTQYAVSKLRANLDLNPALSARVSICQIMLVASAHASVPNELYSSWPLFGSENRLHPQHGGLLKGTAGARALTLDQAMRNCAIQQVHFIKLDVDGNEHSVLGGAQETLKAHLPQILMEISPYLYEAALGDFDQMLQMLARMGYSLKDADTGKALPIDPKLLRSLIPSGGTRNGLFHPA
jgi:FkbM family methyltransferase